MNKEEQKNVLKLTAEEIEIIELLRKKNKDIQKDVIKAVNNSDIDECFEKDE